MRIPRRTWLLVSAASLVRPSRLWAEEWASQSRTGVWQLFATVTPSTLAAYEQIVVNLQQDVTQSLQLPLPRDQVTVVILRNRREYQRYVRTYFPHAPQRPALYVRGRGAGIVLTHHDADAAVNLRHEATHGLLHASLPIVPLWLDEGLAEYFERQPVGRLPQYPQRMDLFAHVGRGDLPTLEQLESLRRVEQMGAAEYVSAWSWVYYLRHRSPAAHQLLQAYLASLAERRPLPRLSERLPQRGLSVEDYQAFWRSQEATG